MGNYNIFKIGYVWHDGDEDYTYLAAAKDKEQNHKDLMEARSFAENLIGKKTEERDYLGKGYSVQCLPEFYEQIVWYLETKLGYVVCYMDDDTEYFVDDFRGATKIIVSRRVRKIEATEL